MSKSIQIKVSDITMHMRVSFCADIHAHCKFRYLGEENHKHMMEALIIHIL